MLQVIVRQSVDKAEFQDFSVEKILKLLFNHCESDEEGVRNALAILMFSFAELQYFHFIVIYYSAFMCRPMTERINVARTFRSFFIFIFISN